jgi:hypothetical protein
VDTGISTWDEDPSPHPMPHILNTLYADNPWFANIKLKEQPRWLCRIDNIGNKKHSSIVLTLEDQESLKELTKRRTIFRWGHPMRIKEYLDTKPNKQCLKCWSLTHNTSTCTSHYKCRRCGETHHEHDHTCQECADTHSLCPHDKCPNCGKEHLADSKLCNMRKAAKGFTSRPKPSMTHNITHPTNTPNTQHPSPPTNHQPTNPIDPKPRNTPFIPKP